jgi:hypothetical protein
MHGTVTSTWSLRFNATRGTMVQIVACSIRQKVEETTKFHLQKDKHHDLRNLSTPARQLRIRNPSS